MILILCWLFKVDASMSQKRSRVPKDPRACQQLQHQSITDTNTWHCRQSSCWKLFNNPKDVTCRRRESKCWREGEMELFLLKSLKNSEMTKHRQCAEAAWQWKIQLALSLYITLTTEKVSLKLSLNIIDATECTRSLFLPVTAEDWRLPKSLSSVLWQPFWPPQQQPFESTQFNYVDLKTSPAATSQLTITLKNNCNPTPPTCSKSLVKFLLEVRWSSAAAVWSRWSERWWLGCWLR